jgi:DNA mismatch repair protein MutS
MNRLACATFVKKDKCKTIITGGYYPALINESFVTNETDLTKNMVITGPNAAGKTTFLKTTMLNIIFTQQFGCGFYSSCSLKPYNNLHCYLNISDTSRRDRLFQAESRRCKEIIDHVILSKDEKEDRHFCIFDELYSGTNPVEATKSAYAFLIWLSQRENVDFILTTHYVDICSKFKEQKARIGNWKMDAIEDETGDIKYTYQLVKGVSKIQGAVKVLREMEYPTEILEEIANYDCKKK